MTGKRIHKTLEEIEAENAMEFVGGEEFEMGKKADWSELSDEETFDDLTEELTHEAEQLLTTDDDAAAAGSTTSTAPVADISRPDDLEVASLGLGFGAGVVLAITGLALSLIATFSPQTGEAITGNLSFTGLTPGLILAIGVILTLYGITRRHQRTLRAQLEWSLEAVHSNAEQLKFLVEAQQQHLSRRPASGEELEQVLFSLARQDDKINNVTKALKIYGKPLVEISRLTTENGERAKKIAAQITTVSEELARGVHEQATALGSQVTAIAEKLADADEKVADVDEKLAAIEQILQAVDGNLEGIGTGLSGISGNIGGIGTSLTGMERDIESIDRNLLGPITDLLNRTRRESTDEMIKAVDLLSEQIASDFHKALQNLPKGDSGAAVMGELRKDLDEIRDTLGRVELDASKAAANASNGGYTAVTSSPSYSSPAPSAPPPPKSPPPSGSPSKISGTAKSSGKSVLGAIAKLKKMR